ncbi:MAG TPA: transaldolase family protein [Stenomitos sp.]
MDAMAAPPLERLQARNDATELWWDSLPASFPAWKECLIASAPPERRPVVERDLTRFWERVRGCTTNPRLVQEALGMNPEAWSGVVRALAEQAATTDPEALYWQLYQDVFRQNALLLRPLWERSAGRHGWLCAQLLPTVSFQAEAMVTQGLALSELAPNLMIKVVGSEQGYEAIEALTSRGIATNLTLSFSASQIERGLEALDRGLATARRDGVDLARWRAVLTFMMGRVGAEAELRQQAESRGLPLGPEDLRWAEVAVARRLYERIQGQGERIKLLLCSLKVDTGPEATTCFHLEKTQGISAVYTVSPVFLSGVLAHAEALSLSGDGYREPVPGPVLDRLTQLPYFQQTLAPHAIQPAEFGLQPAFLRGLQEVNTAYRETLDWIRLVLADKETTHA